MPPLTVLRNAHFGCFITVATTTLPAADAGNPDRPSDWSIHTYRLDPGNLCAPPESFADFLELSVPAPSSSAADADQTAFIKSCTALISRSFRALKIPVPEGSLFAYDALSSTLSVRTKAECHQQIATLETWRAEASKSSLSWRFEILESDATTIRAAVQSAATKYDHTSILQELEARADQGRAQRIASLKLDTKSQQSAHLTTGEERLEVTGFSFDQKFRPSYTESIVKAGVDLEIDAVSTREHDYIALNCAFSYDFSPPRKNWAEVPILGPRPLLVPVYHHQKTFNKSAFLLRNGATRLLNVWSTAGTVGSPKTLQAAFLRGTIVTIQPAVNPWIEAMLTKWGESISPIAKLAPEPVTKPEPEAMLWQRFRLPIDYLPGGVEFSEPAHSAQPRLTTKLVKQILEALGVEFPPGATVEAFDGSMVFAVQNTAENLRRIELFINDPSARGCKFPAVLVTLHVIQADAKLLRKLESQMAGLSDHTAAWKTIEASATQGQVDFLSTQQVATESGVKAKTFTGEQRIQATIQPSEVNPPPKGPATNEETIPTTAQKSLTPLPLHGAFVTQLIGTSLEIDAVVDVVIDGRTVDLDLAFSHDYAPPTDTPLPPAKTAKNALRLGGPEQTFHRFNLNTSLTLSDGKPRLLSIWKPEVTPGTPSAAPADVLQAAFIRVDLIHRE